MRTVVRIDMPHNAFNKVIRERKTIIEFWGAPFCWLSLFHTVSHVKAFVIVTLEIPGPL